MNVLKIVYFAWQLYYNYCV